MHKQRFGHWLVLACMGAVAACTSQGDEGAAGNTNIKLVVNEGNISDTFFTARYQIVCDGADTGPADTPDGIAIDDQRAFEGDFEVTGEVGDATNIFEVLMDLPLGECALRIFVEDEDEVICTGEQTITILSGDNNLFQIRLVCDVSLQTPVGSSVVLADFEEVTGNTCPFVNIVNTLQRIPALGEFTVDVQGRAMDIGNTCSLGSSDPVPPCDCTSAAGLVDGACSTTPPTVLNPGLAAVPCAVRASTLSSDPATARLQLVDACTENTLGLNVGTFAPAGPYFAVADADGNGIIAQDAEYTCDETSPGATIICWLFTDFDTECAKLKCDVRDPANQATAFSVLCPGTDFCAAEPADVCDGDNDCLTDGICTPTCDPVCDPSLGTYDATACCGAAQPGDSCGTDECTQCPGQNDTEPAGTDCAFNSGNVCDGSGNCVQCLLAENVGRCLIAGGLLGNECTGPGDCPVTGTGAGICLPTNNDCDITPVDCQVPSRCSGGNTCTGRTQAPVGAPCSNGECDSNGDCQFVEIDPEEQTKVISVACTNSVTDDVSILDWTLIANPGVILSGDPVTIDYGGIGAFDETFLDAAQSVVPGGVTKAALLSIAATVLPRTGLTGDDATNGVVLGTPDPSVLPFTCNLYTVCDSDSAEAGTACFADSECTGGLCVNATCDPANDLSPPSPACDGDVCGNSGCLFSFGNPSSSDVCRQFVEIPITTTGCDCVAGSGSPDCVGSGNECDTDDLFVAGQNKLATQCNSLGYCVNGGLALPLAPATGNYTAAASGDVLLGWDDTETRLGPSVVCTDTTSPGSAYPDNACAGGAGTWALPAPAVPGTTTVPPPGTALRVNAGGLGVGVDCLMGVRAGNDTVDNDGEVDQSAPTPNQCTQQNVDDGVGCTLGEDLLISYSIQVP